MIAGKEKKVKRVIPGKIKTQLRLDGYYNVLNKYGTQHDSTEYYQWATGAAVTDSHQRYFYWVCIGASVRRHPECGRLYCIHVQLDRRTFRTQQPEKVHQRLPAALVQFGAAGCTGNRQGRYLRGEYRKNSQGVPECSRSDS